jgi:hypothetical protein
MVPSRGDVTVNRRPAASLVNVVASQAPVSDARVKDFVGAATAV